MAKKKKKLEELFGALPRVAGVERLDGSMPSMDFTADPHANVRGDVTNPNDFSNDPFVLESAAADLTAPQGKFGVGEVQLEDAPRDWSNDPGAEMVGDTRPVRDLLAEARKKKMDFTDNEAALAAGDVSPKFGVGEVELEDALTPPTREQSERMWRNARGDFGDFEPKTYKPIEAKLARPLPTYDDEGWTTDPNQPGVKMRYGKGRGVGKQLPDEPAAEEAALAKLAGESAPPSPERLQQMWRHARGDFGDFEPKQYQGIPAELRPPGMVERTINRLDRHLASPPPSRGQPPPGPFGRTDPISYTSTGAQSMRLPEQQLSTSPFERTAPGYTSRSAQNMRLPEVELSTQPPPPPPVAKRRPAAPPPGPESITDPTIRGVVEGTSKALDDTLARYYAKHPGAAGAPAVAQSGPTSAGGTAPAPATSRSPLRGGLESLVMGASPPDTSKEEAELEAAKKKRDEESFAAQIASQFGRYADIQGGTNTGDRGAALREAAGRHEADFAAKKALRDQARKQGLENEDRLFQREGVLEQRRLTAEDRQQKADYNDGASEVSKRRRAQAVALYPSVVARVPPAVWNQMSAADIDSFFKEVAPEKTGKTGAGGGIGVSPAQMNAIRNKLPQHLVDVYNGIGRVKQLVQGSGGWGAQKAGIAGGMIPSVFMDENTRAVRQELGGVVARFLQAGGGKSITANEERVLIGRIAADPTSSNLRPEDLERGLSIIERSMAGSTRQALAGVPDAAKEALYGDLQIPRSWAEQNLASPLGGAPGGGEEMVSVRSKATGKTGKMPKSKFNPAKYELVSP